MTENRNPLAEMRQTYETATDHHGTGSLNGAEVAEWVEALAVTCDPDGSPLSPTAEEILAERLTHPGRGYDDEHDEGRELALIAAAKCYGQVAAILVTVAEEDRRMTAARLMPPPGWPWSRSFWRPSADPVRNLVKAGGLYAAAGDAIRRAAE